jgi:ankyrin repeat protein
VTLNTVDEEGKTPLHWAMIKTNPSLSFFRPSNLETVRLLVEAKADMTIRDASGQLPLDYASEMVSSTYAV